MFWYNKYKICYCGFRNKVLDTLIEKSLAFIVKLPPTFVTYRSLQFCFKLATRIYIHTEVYMHFYDSPKRKQLFGILLSSLSYDITD